jgi:hypothetical protein
LKYVILNKNKEDFMNQALEYGPYTPQEIDRITDWLKTNQVTFELSKDQETEKLAMMNDGQNIVTRAEYRTSVYLGQIFYVQMASMTDLQKAEFDRLFSAKTEVASSSAPIRTDEVDQKMLHDSLQSQIRKKRSWAAVLAGVMLILIGFTVLKILIGGS